MKKSFLLFIALAFVLPAFAIVDNTEVQKAQIKYQRKLDKIKRKQEIQCIKHPERCTASPMVETKLTLGAAQKSVKIGTSQTDVALALGSPNIVTTDSDGKETWIYDKVASVQSYSTNGFEIGAKLGGGGYGSHGAGGGIIGTSYGVSSGNAQSNQRTLTIVIKFNKQKVESFKYHMSNF